MDALALVQQLADASQRAAALARLVALGPQATAALLQALTHGDAGLRRDAAQALADAADPQAAPALVQALADADAQVRGRAAQGLAALGDPHALQALVQTLNDLPDLLHHPHTVATQALTAQGRAALPALLPLLQSPDALTRERAWLVWRSVVEALPAVDWQALWQQHSRYAPDAPAATRAEAARRWGQWLDRTG
jgi:hypothetical protein